MPDRSFTLAGRTITDASPCYVIAECSHNHNGSVVLAREMFRVAADCGADAVKLQKRSPAFYAALRAKGLTDYAAVRSARELGRDQYNQLRDCAHFHGLAFLVTAFDEEAIDLLVRIGVDAIKLASGATHHPALLDTAAATGLPVLLSTGCSDWCDVEDARRIFRGRSGSVAFLQCTSTYPTRDADLHLRIISAYRARFPQIVIGLSSHHQGTFLEPVAYALGARIVEKHFTLSRHLGPGDHATSLDPAGLHDLVENLRAAHRALGDADKRFLPGEEEGRRRLDVTYQGNAVQPMGA